jgi:hypothetical protein
VEVATDAAGLSAGTVATWACSVGAGLGATLVADENAAGPDVIAVDAAGAEATDIAPELDTAGAGATFVARVSGAGFANLK